MDSRRAPGRAEEGRGGWSQLGRVEAGRCPSQVAGAMARPHGNEGCRHLLGKR